MTIEEAKRNVDYLKNQLRRTRSMKMKNLIVTDILSLESYIRRFGEEEFESDVDSFAYSIYRDTMLKEKKKRAFDMVGANLSELKIANNYMDLFDKHEFIPHLNGNFPKVSDEVYAEVLKNFIGTIGEKGKNVYNKIVENRDIVVQDLISYGGVCWDFPTLDKQVVAYNVLDSQYIYFVIAHEIGHAIQMDYMNQVGRRTLESTLFCESISSLMEILFQKYLEGIDFNVFDLYHFNTSVKLDYAASLELSCILAEDNLSCFDGRDIFFEDYDVDKYKDKLHQRYLYVYEQYKNVGVNYQDSVFYTIGDAVARKIFETSKNAEDAINKMLEFLNKTNLISVREGIEYLGLETFIPASLEEDIVRYKFRPNKIN